MGHALSNPFPELNEVIIRGVAYHVLFVDLIFVSIPQKFNLYSQKSCCVPGTLLDYEGAATVIVSTVTESRVLLQFLPRYREGRVNKWTIKRIDIACHINVVWERNRKEKRVSCTHRGLLTYWSLSR